MLLAFYDLPRGEVSISKLFKSRFLLFLPLDHPLLQCLALLSVLFDEPTAYQEQGKVKCHRTYRNPRCKRYGIGVDHFSG